MRTSLPPTRLADRKAALAVTAVFITQFVSWLFINARNIAQPGIIKDLDGLSLFAWLIALPALTGAASTLLFGKLSDIYGRRAILLLSIAIFVGGLALAASSPSMTFLIVASALMSIGHFPIIPLCFTAIGDLFPPAARARWTGLLSLPTGIAAAIGPVLGGVVSESALGWRGLYWGAIPLMLIAGGLVAAGLPRNAQQARPQIDTWGTLAMLLATTTLFIDVSRLRQPGHAGVAAALLLISVAAWVGFLRIEKRTAAPILDPQVLLNRTFLTAAVAYLLACFGMLGIGSYAPIFVQSVMQLNPTASGSLQTPYTMLVAFMGIPTGFILARTGKYKRVYTIAYALAAIALLAMWQFTAATPVWWYLLVTSVAGLGIGAFGTINTLVAQFAVPKRLLGAAVGAMFFFQMVGLSIAPAILGLAQNSAADVESGLRRVFLVGAAAMIVALLLILTIPELAPYREVADEQVSEDSLRVPNPPSTGTRDTDPHPSAGV